MSVNKEQDQDQGARVAVIGAGPIGIDCCCLLLERGHQVTLYERGDEIGKGMSEWGHVRLFSPYSLNISKRMELLLGKDLPPQLEEHPTGAQLVDKVLAPVVKELQKRYGNQFRLELNAEVVSIGRESLRKPEAVAAMGDLRRKHDSFRLLIKQNGKERYSVGYRTLTDTSGSYSAHTANSLGPGGIPALGETSLAHEPHLLRRTIPDVLGEDAALLAGKRVCLVGAGYSAATCLLAMGEMDIPPSSVVWLTRGKGTYDRISGDSLPHRDRLCARTNDCIERPGVGVGTKAVNLRHVAGATVIALEEVAAVKGGDQSTRSKASVVCVDFMSHAGEEQKQEKVEVDVVLALVGYRPNSDLYRELHIHQCYASEGPMKLAASLLAASAKGGGGGDCLKQAAPGKDTLLNPEPNFFILGSKSYGRSSLFLLRVGYEQVDLLASHL